MKYLNKEIARNCAIELTNELEKSIVEKERKLGQTIREKYLLSINSLELTHLLALSNDWTRRSSSIYVKNESGYNGTTFSIDKDVFVKYTGSSLTVSNKEYEALIGKYTEISNLRKKHRSLQEQLIETIVKLRTFERLKKEFPEAYNTIPKDNVSSNLLPAIPIEKLLNEIKALSK